MSSAMVAKPVNARPVSTRRLLIVASIGLFTNRMWGLALVLTAWLGRAPIAAPDLRES